MSVLSQMKDVLLLFAYKNYTWVLLTIIDVVPVTDIFKAVFFQNIHLNCFLFREATL